MEGNKRQSVFQEAANEDSIAKKQKRIPVNPCI